ncbi:MAG TPA: ribonuclease P protein component [Solirubrobacteraceae bacterium]
MKPRQSRRGRLTRSAEFERVYKRGSSCANRHLVLYSFPNQASGASDAPRVGFSVSRRVGGAVERNRVKRVLREAVQAVLEEVRGGHDIVLVARPELLQLAQSEGLRGVQGALVDLLTRAGLTDEQPRQAGRRRAGSTERKAA